MWHHGMLVSCRSVSCWYNLETVIQIRDDACIMLVQLRYDTNGWSYG
jgi:hypothetical protein